MSEAESNQQSLTLTGASNSNAPATEMIPATPATQSLSQQGIQGIDPTHNLISRNRHLLQQVGELEQALRQYQEELQFQQARAQTQETLLLQHRELLKASEEQVSRLFKELESSHQVNQRQQILIETLSHQVENSQERLAQLERDCALTQQRYQEEHYQLQQTETTCEDLQFRLERQQHQTLQFKAALEKSLEVSTSSYFHSDGDEVEEFLLENNSEMFSGRRYEFSEELELLSSDYSNNLEWESLQEPSSRFDVLETELGTKPPDRSSSTSKKPNPSTGVNLPPLSKTSTLEESVLPLLEATQLPVETATSESVLELWEVEETDPMQEVLKDLADPLQSEIEQAIAASLADSGEGRQELGDRETTADEKDGESLLSGASWPSPLVNPLRPTKRLKSWAAIDLPRFPKFRRSSQ